MASLRIRGLHCGLAVLTTVASALLGSNASAQIYVDPLAQANRLPGSNATPDGSQQFPFETITAALAASVAGDVIWCKPGIYSAPRETFPLVIPPNVHVLSSRGAKETVISGFGASINPTVSVYLPHPTPSLRRRTDQVVLVDFRNAENSGSSIQGFTFRGGDIQVYGYADNSLAHSFRVSNCIFDLLQSGVLTPVPQFGLLTVTQYSETQTYPVHTCRAFNNTFIQGWSTNGTVAGQVLAAPGNVAICDVSEPDPPFTIPDPLGLYGVGLHSFQNNLIRCLPNGGGSTQNLRTSFLGVRQDATQVAGAVNTNAFVPGTTGGTAIGGPWFSALPIGAVAPTPAVSLTATLGTGADPGFVGEMLNSMPSLPMPPTFAVRDWRLMPNSPLIGAGVAPTTNGTTQTLTAQNGLTYSEPDETGPFGPITTPQASFLWDGEGYGNLRTVTGQIDIGCDEVELYTLSGNHANDSLSHDVESTPPYNPGDVGNGLAVRHMIFNAPAGAGGEFLLYLSPGMLRFNATSSTPLMGWPGYFPGTFANPAVGGGQTYGVLPPLGNIYLDPLIWTPWTLPTPPIAVPMSWTNPVNGGAYAFYHYTWTQPDGGFVFTNNEQVLMNIGPSATPVVIFGNLQSEYF